MLIATAISLLIAAKLANKFGTRRLFLIGIVGFMLASILCGLAPTIVWLLIGRALQGVSTSLMLTNYLVLIHHQYSDAEQPKIIGLCLSISAIFGIAAPAIEGSLTEWLSWRGFYLPSTVTRMLLTPVPAKQPIPMLFSLLLSFLGLFMGYRYIPRISHVRGVCWTEKRKYHFNIRVIY